jgi:hypothetical protein
MNKNFDIYKPKIGDTMWIEHCGGPKKVMYDYMWGWIADVDDYDQPHVIIDWTFILFDEFTHDVKEYSNSEHYHEIGFTNEDACYEYCNWKYNGWW